MTDRQILTHLKAYDHKHPAHWAGQITMVAQFAVDAVFADFCRANPDFVAGR